MVDVELSRTYPVPRKKGFDYVMDVGTWAEWSPFLVAEPMGVKWEKKRDLVEFTYRTPIGFPVTGAARLKKVVAGELIDLMLMMPGIPDLPVTCEFAHAGPGAFTLTMRVRVEEPEGFWADAWQRLMMTEPLVKRDIKRCLDGLELHLTKKDLKTAA